MVYKKRKLSKKEQKAAEKKAVFSAEQEPETAAERPEIKAKKKIAIPEIISVKDFAERSELPVTEIISELIKNGVLANINENIDFDTAAIIGDDLGIAVVREKAGPEDKAAEKIVMADSKSLKPRPPVVTIMGHVDHGKTTLLDKIRETHVAVGESGGITQHISAYQIDTLDPANKKKMRSITFIDTPGHSAFSTMRSHGASIADIVVLIVAADDGIMPQTKEVIEHAKAHNITIIVAISKVDLPNADIMKVRQQLSEYELIGEEWGGETMIVEISAKTGEGLKQLLEMIILQADLKELLADPLAPATGVVIESHIHKGAGALAVVLIENGTLHLGDSIAVGSAYGKVRILEDFNRHPIKNAGPSTPARVAGLESVPNFADRLISFENERGAKEAAERYLERSRIRKFAAAKTISKDDKGIKTLNLIIKADVAGSLEAIRKSISELKHPEAQIKIISEGVGAIAESDATMAAATGAIILAFRVAISLPAKKIIEKEKITALVYEVIYELVDDAKKTLQDLLPPIINEVETGKGEILAQFRDDKKGVVIGIRVVEGEFKNSDLAKVILDKKEVWRGKIESIRRGREEVNQISSGVEAGIGLPAGAIYSIGGKIVAFRVEETKQTI